MADNKTVFSKTHVKKVLLMAGAERVSADAIEEMEKALVEYGKTVGGKAIELAKMAKRKTLQGSDIKTARKD
ncbi:MAG: Archaeal histone A2 [Candidatus Heimdallarchaeota archaeon LC_3]|nr:MAG: Archaeal histone A2 [Candidatus Heimdallarchaeota archaeon LC_3]